MNLGILNDLDIQPRIVAAVKKAGYTSSWKIIESSMKDIMLKTGLNQLDAERLIKAAALQCSPKWKTGFEILHEANHPSNKWNCIRTGCNKLDSILGGGIPCKGVTELAGESGSGKTQLALQISLQCQLPLSLGGIAKGVAYICTETQFPVSRLNQLIKFRTKQHTFNGKQFSDNIFVHHLPDMDNLVDCVRYQLPQFVAQRSIGLVVIDSVAAVFRAGEEQQVVKSKMVQQLGFKLRQLADSQNVAILAINQVTSTMGSNIYGIIEDNLAPALGLSWANLVTTRLMLRNTSLGISFDKSVLNSPSTETHSNNDKHVLTSQSQELRVRTLDVVFCPWLKNQTYTFIVTKKGVEDADPKAIRLMK